VTKTILNPGHTRSTGRREDKVAGVSAGLDAPVRLSAHSTIGEQNGFRDHDDAGPGGKTRVSERELRRGLD